MIQYMQMNAEHADATAPATVLARWSSSLTIEDLPDRIRRRSSEILLDAVASALAGRNADETGQIETLARSMGTSDEATVIGSSRMNRAGAVLLNGYQVTGSTVCDVYRPASCHVTPEIVPPALAVAEEQRSSGAALLTAVAAGFEVTCRVGAAMNPRSFRERGWHAPGVIGPFGGATAVASLLGLDSLSTRAALGLAGSQSAGTQAQYGTPTIKFHQARGALSGYMAGRLAATGFLSSAEIFTHPDGGVLNVYSDGGKPEALASDLGDHWELEEIALRPWPAASSVQSVVGAVFDMIEAHDTRPDDVARLRIGLAETAYQRHGEMVWDDRFRALLSTRYVASVTLHDRRCWLDQFLPDRIGDAAVGSFARDRIEVEVDSRVPPNGARLEAVLRDGRHIVIERAIPKGDPGDPLRPEELATKLRDAAAGVLAPDATDRVLELLQDVERVSDVTDLCEALTTK